MFKKIVLIIFNVVFLVPLTLLACQENTLNLKTPTLNNPNEIANTEGQKEKLPEKTEIPKVNEPQKQFPKKENSHSETQVNNFDETSEENNSNFNFNEQKRILKLVGFQKGEIKPHQNDYQYRQDQLQDKSLIPFYKYHSLILNPRFVRFLIPRNLAYTKNYKIKTGSIAAFVNIYYDQYAPLGKKIMFKQNQIFPSTYQGKISKADIKLVSEEQNRKISEIVNTNSEKIIKAYLSSDPQINKKLYLEIPGLNANYPNYLIPNNEIILSTFAAEAEKEKELVKRQKHEKELAEKRENENQGIQETKQPQVKPSEKVESIKPTTKLEPPETVEPTKPVNNEEEIIVREILNQKTKANRFLVANTENQKDFDKARFRITLDNQNEQAQKANTIKIAHWNILNYTSTKKAKRRLIAGLILSQNYDLVALTEVTNSANDTTNLNKLNALLNELNSLQTKTTFKGVISQALRSEAPHNYQVERIIMIWNEKKLRAKAMYETNGEKLIAATYTKKWERHQKQNPNGKDTYYYARPPFGMHFETLGPIKNDFTFVSAHFDPPGAQKKRQEIKIPSRNAGAQEIEEALALIKVMDYFDQLDGLNDELIFMGDTNIKAKNHNFAFQTLFNNQYQALLDENLLTTLSTTKGRYANSYDKIFYKGSLNTSAAQKYDLWNLTKEKWIDFKAFQKETEQATKTIRNLVSDHAPISVLLELNAQDPY